MVDSDTGAGAKIKEYCKASLKSKDAKEYSIIQIFEYRILFE